jgi:protein O-GlcNAc transferase
MRNESSVSIGAGQYFDQDQIDARALNDIGNRFLSKENYRYAIRTYHLAIKLCPEIAETYHNLSVAFRSIGKNKEAKEKAQIAVKLKPFFLEAIINLAEIHLINQDYDLAYNEFIKAESLDNSNWSVVHYLGLLEEKQGKLHSAIARYENAIRLHPSAVGSMNNLGCILLSIGQPSAAASQFRNAIDVDANFISAKHNLGMAYFKLSKFVSAEVIFREILRDHSEFPQTIRGLALVMASTGRIRSAVQMQKIATQLDENNSGMHSTLLFLANYDPELNIKETFDIHSKFGTKFGCTGRSEFLHKQRSHLDVGNRKLKVGYVTGDLYNTSMSQFILPIFSGHDRTRFEIFVYDQSLVKDAVKESLIKKDIHYRNTARLSDMEMTSIIQSDSIDILVDLSGHTEGNRLTVFARKPAPISISWGGYGYTTGLVEIDYFLATDDLCPPDSNAYFSERLLRLKRLPAFRPRETYGFTAIPPVKTNGYITLGCLSRSIRINDYVIHAWADILRKLDSSVLVINSSDFKSEESRDWIKKKFLARSISSERLRLGFSSPPWSLLNQIDITLDCWPHNSGTTLLDSLWMGVPFITLASRPSVGRIGASILGAIGRPEWIANSTNEYITKVCELAGNLDQLTIARHELRSKLETSCLFDEKGFLDELEGAYENIYFNQSITKGL